MNEIKDKNRWMKHKTIKIQNVTLKYRNKGQWIKTKKKDQWMKNN